MISVSQILEALVDRISWDAGASQPVAASAGSAVTIRRLLLVVDAYRSSMREMFLLSWSQAGEELGISSRYIRMRAKVHLRVAHD